MEIIVRDNSPYKDVTVVIGNTTHELGLFDTDEVRNLSQVFFDAIRNLNE